MGATWYFDFISPFAYLQWQRVRVIAQRVPFVFRPILFAGLLQQHGHKGPAEIPGKREFTYRFVQWQADRAGIALRFPPAHPFNPIAALRLCIAAGSTPASIDAIFNHIWRDGCAGDDAETIRPVAASLGINDLDAVLADARVKAALRDNFSAALEDGVFGVPSIVAEDQIFWGNDATPMFEQWLIDPELFESESMRALMNLPVGGQRT